MSTKRTSPALAVLLAAAGVSQAMCQPAPDSAAQPPTAASAPAPAQPAVAPPVPTALNPGSRIVDRTGEAVGPIQTLVESPTGPMVVVVIDGKMVSLPQATLSLQGETVVSSQTKAEMLAAAGAPR